MQRMQRMRITFLSMWIIDFMAPSRIIRHHALNYVVARAI